MSHWDDTATKVLAGNFNLDLGTVTPTDFRLILTATAALELLEGELTTVRTDWSGRYSEAKKINNWFTKANNLMKFLNDMLEPGIGLSVLADAVCKRKLPFGGVSMPEHRKWFQNNHGLFKHIDSV